VQRKRKETSGGTKEAQASLRMANLRLKRIIPSICMPNINLEEDFKPVAQQQRRLNPVMKEEV